MKIKGRNKYPANSLYSKKTYMSEPEEERPHHSTLPSMKRRMSQNNYCAPKIYMITLVVSGRRPLFGTVEGDSDAPFGSAGFPHTVLSELGDAVRRMVYGIPDYYPQVAIYSLQIMPDHLHAILAVKERLPVPLGIVVRGFVQGCNKEYRRLFGSSISSPWKGEAQNGMPKRASAFQEEGSAQKKRDRRGDGLLFEHGFNDKVLMGEGQLQRWHHYLADNPRRLLVKRQHPDLFKVLRNLEVDGMTFSAIGNRFLLDRPLMQIQCSRSLSEQGIDSLKATALSACASGVVLVSPSMSPGEKAVMRAAFDKGYPEIVLAENGFGELAKPGGARFDACARGQLLLLAPWEHHNDHRIITRGQCLQLNEMARRLCEGAER
jgi:hypothetical protein